METPLTAMMTPNPRLALRQNMTLLRGASYEIDENSVPFAPTMLVKANGKVFQDRVHDQMRLPSALVAFIDTPQFQRLRDLHQLGSALYIFPCASHSRFEHSLGVAHLAMRMLRQLIANHNEHGPALEVDQSDMLCVGLAGLCHDLGHGPLSHMFEVFVKEARQKRGIAEPWSHEEASLKMIDHLIAENGINLEAHGLTDADMCFVKKLIDGLKDDAPWPQDIGRPESKRFLFDIVANKRNGIDVDKLDYFMRDSINCFGRLPDLNVDRIINCSRVITCDGVAQVCFEDKIALVLGELFHLRAKLHKTVYQHRISKVVDQMILRALHAADEHFTIDGAFGSVRLSDVVTDMAAYTKTGDWIVRAIQNTTAPELAEARGIFGDLNGRRLYSLFGYCEPKQAPPLIDEILEALPKAVRDAMPADTIIVVPSKIVYGSSGGDPGDPLRNVSFYNPKSSMNASSRLHDKQVSCLFTPRDYQERIVFYLCRDPSYAEELQGAFGVIKRSMTANGRLNDNVPFINCSPHRPSARKREREREAGGSQGSSVMLSPRPPVPAFSDGFDEGN
jgi:HD superfamily phosphohydrolase